MVNFYVNRRPSLVSSIVLIFLLLDASSLSYAAKRVVEVNVICKQTRDPSVCSNVLNSIPGGAKGKDLVTLARYTIDVVRANITNTIHFINSLIANSRGHSLTHYKTCLTHFGREGALSKIGDCGEFLKKRDYHSLNVAASDVDTQIEVCVSGESPSDPPFHDPSRLPQYACEIQKIVSILLVIGNLS